MLREPIENVPIPEFGILRFKYPVAFVREDDQLRRYILQLKRREKLKALIYRHTKIQFAGRDEGRRIEIIREPVRRPSLIQGRIFPWHSLELPFREPDLFGRGRH